MNEISENTINQNTNLKSADGAPKDDVVSESSARALIVPEKNTKLSDGEVPLKKRKTRRGKSKRRPPYQKYGRKSGKIGKQRIVKPEAPHNDNQFLFEDHGGFEELDERLKNIDQASSSTVITRTRDSSFSVDSDGEEFYSSPDDEGDFLMQDFNDQYQSVQIEQLHTMSKQELIEEYLALDNRTAQKNRDFEETIRRLEKELDKQNSEKEMLQRENESLKSKLEKSQNGNSDSEDSETDSSDSCSSSTTLSTSGSSRSPSPNVGKNDTIDFTHTNGHSSSPTSVDAS